MSSKKNNFLLTSSKFVTANRKMLKKYIYTTQLNILFYRKSCFYNINKRNIKGKR